MAEFEVMAPITRSRLSVIDWRRLWQPLRSEFSGAHAFSLDLMYHVRLYILKYVYGADREADTHVKQYRLTHTAEDIHAYAT
jgi:hypothetical protein